MGNFESPILKNLLENANIAVVIHRWDTSVVYANPTALRLLRLTHEQMLGKDALDPVWRFIDEDKHPLSSDQFPVTQVKRFKGPVNNMIMGVIDSAQVKPSWFMVNAYPEIASKEKDSFIVITFSDITEQKGLFSFKAIADNSAEIVIVTEADDLAAPLGPRIVYVNEAFVKLTGYSREEAIGETPRILQGKETDPAELKRISTALKNRSSVSAKVRNYTKTGHPYWLDINIFPLTNRYNEVTHFAAIQRDITQEIYSAEQLESNNKKLKELKVDLERLIRERTIELHDANKKLFQYAYYDVLTQIPNRRCFLDQAEKLLSRAKRGSMFFLVGIVDVDYFKNINDTFGHDMGDKVLIKVAECFSLFFRQEDVFGRYGGEEFGFCILLEDDSQAVGICERLRVSISALCFTSETHENFTITASIGVCVSEATPSLSVDTQLKKADIALYKAKGDGRNKVEVMLVSAIEKQDG